MKSLGIEGGSHASFMHFRYFQFQQQNAIYFFLSTSVIIFSFI